MSAIELQLKTEARYDVIVNCALLALLFGGLALLPRSAFWWYWVPIVAFYLRYTWVRVKRDEALRLALDRAEIGTLVGADGLRGAGKRASRCYSTESGICITDGTHHILVARQERNALIQLSDIVRDQ